MNKKNKRDLTPILALGFAQSGCGGGGGSTSPETPERIVPNEPPDNYLGRLYDGPVSGANVYIDVNNDGQINAEIDHFISRTDGMGQYSGHVPEEHHDKPLIADLNGATDIGDPNVQGDEKPTKGFWRAPPNSKVINPLTEYQVKTGKSDKQVAADLGLPANVKVSEHDPFDGKPQDDTDKKVVAAGQKLAKVLADNPNADANALEQEVKKVFAPPPPPPVDKAPTAFTLSANALELEEATSTARDLASIDVTDADGGPSGLTLSQTGDFFVLDGTTLKLADGKVLSVGTHIATLSISGLPDQIFTLTVTAAPPVEPEPESDPMPQDTVAIYENHPLNKAIVDLDGDGSFALSKGYKDNKHFKIDSDGKVWWKALADYEKPKDKGKDNIYEIKVIHTASDGTETEVEVEVTVQDIQRELTFTTQNDFDPVYSFSYNKGGDLHKNAPQFEVKSLIPEDQPYTHLLLTGHAFYMPKTGPLEITWSIVTEQSPSAREDAVSSDKLDAFRAMWERAFAEYERIINIKFIEVPDTADSIGMIRIGNNQSQNNGASVWLESIGRGVASINITNVSLDKFSIYLHELGHVLGIDHPFETDKPGGWPGDKAELKTLNSIMTYNNGPQHTLTQNDINALQFLYGAPGEDGKGLEQYFLTPPEVY